MASRVIATGALIAIALFGNYSILGLIQRNGWASMFADAISQDKATQRSNTDTSSETSFPGISPVNFFLDQLLRFFQPCISGERPVLSLFAAYFAGQVLPMHTALVLEGLRTGNKGAIISFSTIWALAYQSIPAGIIMAVYCVTHIWTSPLAVSLTSFGPMAQAKLLSVDPAQSRVITGAMVLGYVLPTILPALPSPRFISPRFQRVSLGVWQFFPVWVHLSQVALVFIGNVLAPVADAVRKSPESRLIYSRRVYRNILSVSAALHFGPILCTLFPQLRSIFSISNLETVDLKGVFLPMSAFSPRPVQSIAEGCQILLQYDMYCALAAALLWVTYLSSKFFGSSIVIVERTIIKSLLRICVVGPGGALLWALWDRDERALAALSGRFEADGDVKTREKDKKLSM